MAIASMVLGLVALAFAVFGGVANGLGIFIGVVGLVLGAVSRKKVPSGMATAGIVMSIIAISLPLVFWLTCIACIVSAGSAL